MFSLQNQNTLLILEGNYFVLEMYPLITCRLKVQCESSECMTAYSNFILNPND